MNTQEIISSLISINSIKINLKKPFKWASGWNSPIYCDNRIILSHIKERKIIQNLFCSYIKKYFQSVNYVAGVATGAIAHGMMIASTLDLPFIYVRDKAKNYGRENQIEGNLKKGSNVIVIEDLISTGKSSINAIKAIEKTGSKVNGLMSIFTYDFLNTKNLKTPCVSLCNYSTLIEVAIDNQIITEEEREILSTWKTKI